MSRFEVFIFSTSLLQLWAVSCRVPLSKKFDSKFDCAEKGRAVPARDSDVTRDATCRATSSLLPPPILCPPARVWPPGDSRKDSKAIRPATIHGSVKKGLKGTPLAVFLRLEIRKTVCDSDRQATDPRVKI
ncbi:hypothetical protein C8R47DRAFT_1078446 [Mycena vitilis]|nr:hypothetical protein C8R47DRAFT_1078446 [Mycena vitilis]